MREQLELTTSKMPGETLQQYTVWQLYCLTGSINKLLSTWEGLLHGYLKMSPELEDLKARLGQLVVRKTIQRWSKQFHWVKRTDLKIAEDVDQIRTEAKRFEKERKYKIIKAFRKALDTKLKKLDSGEEVTVAELKQLWEMTRTEMGLVTDRSSLSVTGEQRLLTPEEEKEGQALDDFVKKFHDQKRKEEKHDK
jgi:hypothetical protein